MSQTNVTCRYCGADSTITEEDIKKGLLFIPYDPARPAVDMKYHPTYNPIVNSTWFTCIICSKDNHLKTN